MSISIDNLEPVTCYLNPVNLMSRFPNLDDLVFESRNKKYGAYTLRKEYKRVITRSVIYAVTIFMAVALSVFIFYNVDFHPGNSNFIITYEPFDLSPAEELLPPPPQEKPLQKKEIEEIDEEKEITLVPADSLREKSKPAEPESSKTDSSELSKTESSENDNDRNNEQGGGSYDGLITTLQALPSFPGGDLARLNFLRYNINYPEEEKKKGIQGVVIVTFTVEKDGSLSNIKVTKGVSAGINEEALRVVKLMPKWYPGVQHGKPVNVTIKLPIRFTLR